MLQYTETCKEEFKLSREKSIEFRILLMQHGWRTYDVNTLPECGQCDWYAVKVVDNPTVPECTLNEKAVQFVLMPYGDGSDIFYDLHITAQTNNQFWFRLQTYGHLVSEWEHDFPELSVRLLAAWQAVQTPKVE